MKKFRLSLLLMIFQFLLAGIFASEGFSQSGKTFLWRVQTGESTVYLLGSIHLLKKENYPLDPKIETAFERSGILVVEANIQDQGKMNQQRTMEMALYPPNDSIIRHLTPETYGYVQKEAAQLGISMEAVNRQKPWFLSMSLEAMELMKLGYDPGYGVDNYFLSRAAGRKKILELENVEEQMNLLAGLSDPDQELLLLMTLKDLQNASNEIGPIIQAWNAGDADALEAVITQTPRGDRRLVPIYEKLISDRNQKMLPKIEGYLKEKGTYFVVVGAGHLVGEKGIPALLAKRGYKVEQQ